jgi:hypothetical protein
MGEPIKIKIPEINNWFSDFTQIMWHINKLQNTERIELDLEDVKFIEPGGVLILTLICNQIYNITENQVKLINVNNGIVSYLERINFFQYKFVQKPRIPLFEQWSRNSSSMLLLELTYLNSPFPQLTQILGRLNDILIKWIYKNKDDPACSNIITIISEICNNSFEHSILRTSATKMYGPCFLFAQVYSKGHTNEVDIAVGDLGIGIRKSLEIKYNWIYPSDVMVLKKVLEGLSGRTFSDRGGSGIPYVVESTMNNFNGEYFLRTGKGIVMQDMGNKMLATKELMYAFPGTQWVLKLRC